MYGLMFGITKTITIQSKRRVVIEVEAMLVLVETNIPRE